MPRRLCLLAVLVFFAAPASGDARQLHASGWVPYWAQDEASRTVAGESDLFRSASPFWYSADAQGRIHSAPGAGSKAVRRRLSAAHLDVIPTVTAPIGPRQAIKLLGHAGSRRRHVNRIVDLARRYDGIDLNYEHPALTTKRRPAYRVRAVLSRFYKHACAALERNRRECVVTVMPRTDTRRSIWRGKLTPWVYDYRAIGTVADTVRVMAYDQHAGPYGPGPIAGAPWTRRVARFAAATMPPRKVELGVSLYGRQWEGGRERPNPSAQRQPPEPEFARETGGTEISSLTWRQAVSLRRSCGARARWSRRELAPWFRCGGRTVWYSNARSTRARAAIASQAGLSGIALWAPYGEDPATWRTLRKMGRFGR